MKFSEHMLLGSSLLKAVPYTRNNDQGGGCALGMAEKSSGLDLWLAVEDEWAFLKNSATAPCGHTTYRQKICGESEYALTCVADVIIHIFNEHVCEDATWTIEQLADWIRSVEPADPEVVAAETEVMRSELCEATSSGK